MTDLTPEKSAAGQSTWCEVSLSALRHNVAAFRAHVGDGTRLGVVVKSNAYGHGLALASQAFIDAGADWLIVNTAQEAADLRALQPHIPLYICGPVFPAQARLAVAAGASTVVYDAAQVRAFAEAAAPLGHTAKLHIKVETGNHRQGLGVAAAVELGRLIADTDGVALEGITTHYADADANTGQEFTRGQTDTFEAAARAFEAAGLDPGIRHASNSAATILYPQTHAQMVRVGIAGYGCWPSTDARAMASVAGFVADLRPALSWRVRIAQIKDVPAGCFVGYGRTFKTTQPTRLAVLPVGYHEGYDRALSSIGVVLVDGQRAPVRGRVCMNLMMVDVTHIPAVSGASIVTLLGADGSERITAEEIAGWIGTINYEVVSRVHPSIQRIATP